MARTPDKPGTYRIREKGFGSFLVTGVRKDGSRIRVPGFGSRHEAETFASTLFPANGFSPNGPVQTFAPSTIPEIITGPQSPKVDEWGLPVVTEETARDIGAAMGIPVTPKPSTTAETDAKVKEVQEKRKKYAQSFMQLGGHAYAMGVVMGSTKLVAASGRTPVKPSPKQVTDLAEVTADTLREWFGDVELKPWMMMCLLSIGIPLSMWIQSPKALPKRPTESQPQESDSPNLRSVT